MRVAAALFGLAIALIGAGIFISLPSAPAKDRLSGVTVTLASSKVATATDGRKQLWADVVVQSIRPVNECLRFALDEPFQNRALDAPLAVDDCVKPDPMAVRVTLRMPSLDEMDTYIPDHEILWGGAGGCGWMMGIMGMCSVDVVGYVPVKFPVKSLVPTLRPGQTFGPLMPFPTFDVNQFND
jgi:hypothetical protein